MKTFNRQTVHVASRWEGRARCTRSSGGCWDPTRGCGAAQCVSSRLACSENANKHGIQRTHVARQRVRANEIRQATSLNCHDSFHEGSPSAFAEQLAQTLVSEGYSGADGASCGTYSRRASLLRPQDVVDAFIIDDEARRHQHRSRRPISMSLRLR